MRHVKISILALLFLLSLVHSSLSQTEKVPGNALLWRTKAFAVTDLIVRDIGKVDETGKALFYAKLGDSWWEHDRNRAAAYFEKAVDVIFFLSPDEIKSNPKRYRLTISQVFRSVSGRDPKQTSRLISLVSSAIKDEKPSSSLDADTILELSLSIAKTDPDHAAALGRLSIEIGPPGKLYLLYWELRKSNAAVADQFIRSAISFATASPNPQIAISLRTAVFPEITFPAPPTSLVSSDRVRSETLGWLADYLANQFAKFVSKTVQDCSQEALVLSPLREQYLRALPQRAPAVLQAISLCLDRQAVLGRDEAEPSAAGNVVNDIDQLLKLADDSKDNLQLRAYYLFRAVSLANDQGKYRLATEILARMSDDERNVDPEYWDTLRYTIASGWALQQIDETDLIGARQTLESVPADSRPLAKVGFAIKCKSANSSFRQFCLERLSEARDELMRSGKSFNEKSSYWLHAIRILWSFGLEKDATDTLADYVKAYNKESEKSNNEHALINYREFGSIISANFFIARESQILQAVQEVKDAESRLDLNLELLKLALRQTAKTDR